MVLAAPASRSCRKPGDCGYSHLSCGQDNKTLSPGREPFELALLLWNRVNRGQDRLTQFLEHFRKDILYTDWICPPVLMCILCVHLRLSDCRKYSPHPRLRLQCCVYPPAGHHHSASHSHESFARAVSCISKFCTHPSHFIAPQERSNYLVESDGFPGAGGQGRW